MVIDMASITIRNLDDELKAQLRVRAAQHGRSMEQEVRVLLQQALSAQRAPRQPHLVELARALFGPQNGVDLALPPRAGPRRPPSF